MLRRSLLSLLVTVLCGFTAAARAEIVVDIYGARLPMVSRGDIDLAAARRDGLAQVLVKASGDAAAAARPAVAAALSEADRYLLSYSYVENDGEGLWLRLDYDERAVQALLRSAGLPLWTANRPAVLVWLVYSDGVRRRFVGPADMPAEADALAYSFERRGLPLQLPLLDLQDVAALNPGEAWRQSSAALVDASRRYRGTELLAGRVARTSAGRWVGDWRLLYGGRWLSQPVDTADFADFADAGSDLVARTVAGRYAVNLADSADLRHRVILRGVRSYGDFAAARQILEGLEAVRRVVPERLVGDQVSLRVEADADLVQLARIIELDRRFVAVPAAAGELGLLYEWMR